MVLFQDINQALSIITTIFWLIHFHSFNFVHLQDIIHSYILKGKVNDRGIQINKRQFYQKGNDVIP